MNGLYNITLVASELLFQEAITNSNVYIKLGLILQRIRRIFHSHRNSTHIFWVTPRIPREKIVYGTITLIFVPTILAWLLHLHLGPPPQKVHIKWPIVILNIFMKK